MIHFVLIDDCYPINTRNRKIVASLEQQYPDARITILTWDRQQEYDGVDKRYCVYSRKSAYGNKLDKLKCTFGYRTFCHNQIKALNPDIIIASHWNNLIIVPKLRNEQMLIYENLDIPTEGWLVRNITAWLERRAMRHTHLTIHASRFFKKLYPDAFPQVVMENKPVFDAQPVDYSPATPLRISFIGGMRYPEILCNLVDAVRDDKRFTLSFHGDGHALPAMKEYAKGMDNVRFTGYYEYKDIEGFYRQADVLWAAYPNKDFNVRYAISNKFHESLVFGIPAIYSDKTELGEYVSTNHLGLQVNPYSTEEIRSLLSDIASGAIDMNALHSHMIEARTHNTTWNEDFQQVVTAIDDFMAKRK